VGLEDFLKSVIQQVKQHVKYESGELRLYPPHLLCMYLISEFRDIRDLQVAGEVLAVISILLQECRDVRVASMHFYINVLPKIDPYPYLVKLIHP
jgi:hypothetical protein